MMIKKKRQRFSCLFFYIIFLLLNTKKACITPGNQPIRVSRTFKKKVPPMPYRKPTAKGGSSIARIISKNVIKNSLKVKKCIYG